LLVFFSAAPQLFPFPQPVIFPLSEAEGTTLCPDPVSLHLRNHVFDWYLLPTPEVNILNSFLVVHPPSSFPPGTVGSIDFFPPGIPFLSPPSFFCFLRICIPSTTPPLFSRWTDHRSYAFCSPPRRFLTLQLMHRPCAPPVVRDSPLMFSWS